MSSSADEIFARDQKQELPIVATKEICQNGTFIITGANTGLGYEAAKHFVQASAAKVILAVRTLSKGEAAKSNIETETGITGVAEVWPLDMSSYASIKAFAEKVKGLDRVDAIVENAAQALDKWSVAEGLETTLTVNVTGTMLLAGLVAPKLQESAKKFGILPHISIIGSGVAFSAGGELEKIGPNQDSLAARNTEDGVSGMQQRYVIFGPTNFLIFC
jgi:NAD(P)-dependent dehydrogenase (short-subunit alcohol dehydrogenase family)